MKSGMLLVMDIRLEFVAAPPDPPAFEALMREYFRIVTAMLADAGGPDYSPEELAGNTVAHLGDLAPPEGRILLATRENGTLMGCGFLRRIRPDAAELKRMFVRPEAQGQGLGRRLFEMRIAEARRMGCTTLYADTVKGNTAMLSMYEKFGFAYIRRYPENANVPELEPWLVYLQADISEEGLTV
jgi:GNAT superfamily N-acetyltransferase